METTHLWDKITEKDIATLKEQGVAVIDDFLPETWASELRDELKFLQDEKLLHPNEVRFLIKDEAPKVVRKPNIYEMDLHNELKRKLVPHYSKVFDATTDLCHRLNGLYPDLKLRTDPGSTVVKLQCNEGGGGCFPWHYDNPGDPDKRRLTCLIYLNENWQEGDGGEICASSFLIKRHKVAPLMNRMVMFYSERMLHRVLPALKPRYCFTIWTYSDVANVREETLSWPGLDSFPAHLGLKSYANINTQRQLSRAVYEEEYETSIKECFEDDDEAREILMTSHHARIKAIRQNPQVSLLCDQLRNLKENLNED